MTGYVTPADYSVSCSWQCHRDRNPPSGEPGTDIATPYGTDLRIAGDGAVSYIDHGNGGAEGRRLSVDLDDGRRVSYIHLSAISAYHGQRVSRGQTGVIWSGASGYGNDHHYGPHVHVSLFPSWSHDWANTLDFMLYIGEDDVPDMDANQAWQLQALYNLSLVFTPEGSPMYSWAQHGANGVAAVDGKVTEVGTDVDTLVAAIPTTPTTEPCPDTATASSLTGPAWVVGALLGLIGLVEVVRLVVDILR